MIILSIDIETAADLSVSVEHILSRKSDKRLKDPQKIEENRDKIISELGLSPLTGKIIFIGVCISRTNEPSVSTHSFGLDGKSERETLIEFWEFLNQVLSEDNWVKFVTYNGKEFDIPFILIRSTILNITNKVFKISTTPYSVDSHIDLFLNVFGKKSTLNEWAFRYNLILSPDRIGGDMVQGLLNLGDFETIKSKCLEDCEITLKLYEKVKNIV